MREKTLTLGSLFDGSGGFPLGGVLAGMTPLWSSEIEPFAVRVTTARFPQMKHYGDVSTIRGADLEPVDVITFGSPCQDMSIAGKRSGLDGSRSSLFYEAIRIVKEMRCETNGEKPRFIVWENVPGAFSSNHGADFKAVLEAVIGVKAQGAEVPAPEKGWPYADCYLGDGWSVAYRMLDAQYWGVPQRRARIFLVADFAGERAPEILFESEGMSGYSQPVFRAWQRAASDFENRLGASGRADEGGRLVLCDQGGERMDVLVEKTSTLRAEAHHPPVVLDEPAAAGFCTEHSANARGIGYEEETAPTLRAGVVPAAIAVENHPTDSRVKISEEDISQTLTSRMGTGGNNVPLVMEGELPARTIKIRSGCEGGGKGILEQVEKSATIGCNNDQTLFVPYGICSKGSNSMKSDNPHSGFYEAQTSRTLDANGGRPDCAQGGIAIVAFTQNQRDEVRDLKDVSGALSAEPGMKQQTYVAQPTYSLQGNMIGRDDKNGPQGSGVNEDVSFTLDATDRHGVVYCMTTGDFTQVEQERTPTLMARDYKDPPVVTEPMCFTPNCDINGDTAGTITRKDTLNYHSQCVAELGEFQNPKVAGTVAVGAHPSGFNGQDAYNDRPVFDYIVRRLTPTECARLQGFPDWWCQNLGIENPTQEDIAFWREVFETHRRVLGKTTKPKTDKQIIKWLRAPYSDSAEYRLWGNGVCLPIVYFVMSGIAWAAEKTE